MSPAAGTLPSAAPLKAYSTVSVGAALAIAGAKATTQAAVLRMLDNYPRPPESIRRPAAEPVMVGNIAPTK